MAMATDKYMAEHKRGFAGVRYTSAIEQVLRGPKTFVRKPKASAPELTSHEVLPLAKAIVKALEGEYTALGKMRNQFNVAMGLDVRRSRRFLTAEKYAIEARDARATIAGEIARIHELTRV